MRLRDLGPGPTQRMLDRLGVDAPPVTVEGLRTLHRAFLDAVPYENLRIQAGIPTSLDPVESAERIAAGEGGYCYHLNGVLGSLLCGLGFPARLVVANPDPDDPQGWGRHVLLILDFPDEGWWLADVGIGDGFRDPLPLRAGAYRQEPFEYRIERLDDPLPVEANGRAPAGVNGQPHGQWRWRHDPLGTLRAFDLDPTGCDPDLVARTHHFQSTSPESSFVRRLTVQSRRADRTVVLRGCVRTVVDAAGKRSHDVTNEADWWSVITDEFGIRVDGFAPEARDELWRRTRKNHEAWDAAGRP